MKNFNVVVMNFTGVYKDEDFYKDKNASIIECEDIRGTFGYTDDNAVAQIKERIHELTPEGIHFIDSGNYHYISKIWTDKIKHDFALIVFDHHSDMQPSLFESLMSCGCWIKSALDTNTFLKKVILVGVEDQLAAKIPKEYFDRIVVYSQNQLEHKEAWDKLSNTHLGIPVYISIDKDVLSQDAAATDWDQGDLTLKELKLLLYEIIIRETVIGVDICGECSDSLRSTFNFKKDILNNQTNLTLLNLLEKLHEYKITH